ncbi:hypothetical protein NC653_009060 [Populus alba x Populus x berolinensis]|uniref:Uncharacterized protein n=1 Tax=Populus alba x Populus x berolinensis TaxID=444605 RepID=A0AAD6W981_9ROSI|nr:hypothetical protein NC653_009051 [Populus alba x Populus x berolinensis]KAJ7004055.1 hypothetical protein NC653_009060 [Populus alba x Populus x berolinensis]
MTAMKENGLLYPSQPRDQSYYWPSFLEMDPKFLINWFSMLSRYISPTSWGEVSSNMNWDV